MSLIGDQAWAYRTPGLGIDALSDLLDAAGIDHDGLSEDSGTATAWFNGDRPPSMPVEGDWEQVLRSGWAEAWKVGLDPVVVGEITIAMPWHAPGGPVLDGPPFTIVVEPGLAFGTGHHETTATCLGALQALDLRGRRVIDIGTGTAVLAIAAWALGASEVVGVDVDLEAIVVARENVAAHGLTDEITLALGSCAEAGAPADVVVANIITDKVMGLADDLAALLRPSGTLIVCGIDVARTGEAVDTFARAGLDLHPTPGVEWSLLVGGCTRPRGACTPGP